MPRIYSMSAASVPVTCALLAFVVGVMGHIANCPSANPVASWKNADDSGPPPSRQYSYKTYIPYHCGAIGYGFNGRTAVFRAAHVFSEKPAAVLVSEEFVVETVRSTELTHCFSWSALAEHNVYGVIVSSFVPPATSSSSPSPPLAEDGGGSSSAEPDLPPADSSMVIEYIPGELAGTGVCGEAGMVPVVVEFCYAPTVVVELYGPAVHRTVRQISWQLAVTPTVSNAAVCRDGTAERRFAVTATAEPSEVVERHLTGSVSVANPWDFRYTYLGLRVYAVSTTGDTADLTVVCDEPGDVDNSTECAYSGQLAAGFVPRHVVATVPGQRGAFIAGIDCADVMPELPTTHGTEFVLDWNGTQLSSGTVTDDGIGTVFHVPMTARVRPFESGSVVYETALTYGTPAGLAATRLRRAVTMNIEVSECW